MDVECVKCGAMHFMSEKLTKSAKRSPKFGVCCLQGQIQLPPLPPLPAVLKKLYNGRDANSEHFLDNIRRYNTAFAFTSVGVKLDDRVTHTTGPYAFKIQGALSHRMGGLLPMDDEQPAFAQLYILDSGDASAHRGAFYDGLMPGVLGDILNVLETENPYVRLYKQAYEISASKPPKEQNHCAARIVVAPNTDTRRYNLPTSIEVAAIIPGSGEENIQENREIILQLQQPREDIPTRTNFKRISHLHPLYMPLHYVLLFPSGETGWHIEIPTVIGETPP
jgi:hypothetical protein